MASPTMPPIEGLRVRAVELAHAQGKIRLGSFNKELIVMIHETVGMALPAKSINQMSKSRKKGLTILIAPHNLLPGIATTRHIIDSMGKL